MIRRASNIRGEAAGGSATPELLVSSDKMRRPHLRGLNLVRGLRSQTQRHRQSPHKRTGPRTLGINPSRTENRLGLLPQVHKRVKEDPTAFPLDRDRLRSPLKEHQHKFRRGWAELKQKLQRAQIL